MSVANLIRRLVSHSWPWARINRLRRALDAVTDTGIYPAAVIGGKNPYSERSPYQNGWNDCAIEAMKRMQGILKPGDWPFSDAEDDG